MGHSNHRSTSELLLPETSAPSPAALHRAGLVLGPIVLTVMLLVPSPAGVPEAAWRTAAVGALMAIWWITEAIPIPATALLPLVLFPLLGVANMAETAAPYADPVIFLFLGGFLIAKAMQRWLLHRRIALAIIGRVGTRPHHLIGGFMLASAFLSMWVSNTATVVMMLPIGISVVELMRRGQGQEVTVPFTGNFGIALMLGIAYGSSIGGIGTLIGTPPNALLAGYLRANHAIDLGFGEWMVVAMPLVIVALPLTWFLLTRFIYPVGRTPIAGSQAVIEGEVAAQGPVARAETLVGIVFVVTAVAWVGRPFWERWLPGLTDAGIAIAAAVSLFLIPVSLPRREFLLDWESARSLPWDVLILFGGGLSLASAITRSGLARTIGEALEAAQVLPFALLVMVIAGVLILLTELASNTASAAAFLPVVAALAVAAGLSPMLLTVPAALAASCAFMLPVATPPNAIVYGSGAVTIPQMVKAGAVLNVVMLIIITLFTVFVVPLAFH